MGINLGKSMRERDEARRERINQEWDRPDPIEQQVKRQFQQINQPGFGGSFSNDDGFEN